MANGKRVGYRKSTVLSVFTNNAFLQVKYENSVKNSKDIDSFSNMMNAMILDITLEKVLIIDEVNYYDCFCNRLEEVI